MVNNMIRLIKDIIFGFRFKRAVRKADRFHHITHRKYMVLVINKKLEVLSKQEVKSLWLAAFSKREQPSEILRVRHYI